MEEFNNTNSSYQQICNGFLENGTSKIVSISISVILSFLVLPLLYGIIWYERFGTDLKRTLINQLFASVCWYLMTSIILIQVPITVRFMIQMPLNHFICATLDFIAASLLNMILG
jgi:hypothetical protein